MREEMAANEAPYASANVVLHEVSVRDLDRVAKTDLIKRGE